MYPDPLTDALVFELEERHSQMAMHPLARSCNRIEARRGRTLRRALGGVLVRLGTLVSRDGPCGAELLTQEGHK